MDDLTPITRVPPVASRADVLSRLRAHEDEIRHYGVTGLYLFGSAARDEMRADSDVDVFVDYEPGGTFDYFALCDLERLFQRVLSRRVDVPTRQGLHERLRADIVSSAVRVF